MKKLTYRHAACLVLFGAVFMTRRAYEFCIVHLPIARALDSAAEPLPPRVGATEPAAAFTHAYTRATRIPKNPRLCAHAETP